MPLVGEVGKNNVAGSASTLAVTVTTAPGASSFLTIRVSGSQAVTSITDTKSNTWALDKSAASSPLSLIASTAQNGGALTTSDTVTVNYSASSTNRSAIIDEFTGVAASPLDQTATGTGATTSRTGGTTGTTTQADELVIGCFAIASAETSFTPGAGYSNFTTTFLGGLSGEYKIVSATGTQNPTATGGTSGTSHGVTATYKLTTAPVNTVAPVVSGTPLIRQVLSTTSGTWV